MSASLDPRPPGGDQARRAGRRTRRSPRAITREPVALVPGTVGSSRRSSSRSGEPAALREPASRAKAASPIDGAEQRGRPQLLRPSRLHGGDQQHAETTRGAVPLSEDGAGQGGRRGQLQPVGDGGPRRGQLHQPHALEPAGAEDRGNVVGGGRCRAQADRRRDEDEEEHGESRRRRWGHGPCRGR